MDVIIGVVGVVLVFGLAVFVHEFGHYIFARLRGVGVEAFAIGMGPKIVAWKHGGTEYSIRWLPIGGFVRLHQMIREEAEAAPESGESAAKPAEDSAQAADKAKQGIGESVHADMEALYNKGFVTKLLVFGGGVFFNYVTAIIALAVLLMVGFSQPTPPTAWVGSVTGEPFIEAGLQVDDRFVEIEGNPANDLMEFDQAFFAAVTEKKAEDGLDVKVRRGAGSPGGSEVVSLKLPAAKDLKSPPYFDEEGRLALGFDFETEPHISAVVPYRRAEKAGIKRGDVIIAVNGEPVDRASKVRKVIESNLEQAVSLTIQRKSEEDPQSLKEVTLSVVPEENPEDPTKGQIGVYFGSGEEERVKKAPLEAIAMAPGETTRQLVNIAKMTYGTFEKAFSTGNFKSLKREVGGPAAIFNLTYRRAQEGLPDLLDWFIKLNLILAIMNLLPIPILDGGFILLSSIEAIVRRPVPVKVLTPIYTFFFFCFITLFVLVSYQDIMNIFFRR